jgi:nucleoside-diphosphate-sugar epimerase
LALGFGVTIAKVAGFYRDASTGRPSIIAFSAIMAKLIFGCGYLGRRLARLWIGQGQTVYAVTRSGEKATLLAAEGIQPIIGDPLAGPLPIPRDIRTVLFAVGYDRDSQSPIQDVYAGGLRRAAELLKEDIGRFIYISTTGVYGSAAGEEVDENTPCQPLRAGGAASLAAENFLNTSKLQSRAVILRLAGIYGPGRIPRAADLVAGRPIDAPAIGWLNLIHVDDAAQIVLLAEQRAPLPRTYVVSDGQPVQRAEYYAELARLLKAPPPRFVDPPASSPAAARAASDKRIAPRRMFAELSPKLQYPSYREGLAAIVAAE